MRPKGAASVAPFSLPDAYGGRLTIACCGARISLTAMLQCETLLLEPGLPAPVRHRSESTRTDALMSDVVVELPVRNAEEAQLFGDYLSRFLHGRDDEAELWAADNDAPYLMIHSDPRFDLEMKVVTFQERRAAL